MIEVNRAKRGAAGTFFLPILFKLKLPILINCLSTQILDETLALVHTVRALLEDPNTSPDTCCLLQVDLINAFNRVNRATAFQEVRQLCLTKSVQKILNAALYLSIMT